MTIEEATALAQAEIDAKKTINGGEGMFAQVNNVRREYTEKEYEQAVFDLANSKMYVANEKWMQDRAEAYPSQLSFIEAYTEKEILGESEKWDAYVVDYNKVRSDNPKPE